MFKVQSSKYIVLIALFMAALPLKAQDTGSQELRQTYALAEELYCIGRLEETIQLLEQNVTDFPSVLRQNAYRLIALSYLALDHEEAAEKAVMSLLNENPYYTSVQDPSRFQDMVNRLKTGRKATITTASKLAESVEEAPVPVTLITEDMIRMSTARNLLELLEDYVPGVNIVEGEEANFAMRGVHSYSQENVLIMLNGVRLNSYCTNSIAPDFRISLANIKQIEVLRGAASSLYGNVALSAVVNILTKTGSEVNGLQATGGIGNTNTYKGDLVWGKHFVDTDLLAWGSIYSSSGTRHDIKGDDPQDSYGVFFRDSYIYTNGFNHKPAYDFGVRFKWKSIELQASHQYGKRNYTYNNIYYVSSYSYDKYETINGIKPGRGVASTNASLRYSDTWGKWSLDAGVNVNFETANLYNVLGDSIDESISWMLSVFSWKEDEYFNYYLHTQMSTGFFQTQSWKDWNLSADMKAIYEYSTAKIGRGSLLLGFQYDYFDLYYNDFSVGDNYDRIAAAVVNDRSTILQNNQEKSLSTFVQLKHQFNRSFILNAGLRVDIRNRYTDKTIRQRSPRVALIWSPTKQMNYKLSYARSFVDAPYFYRASRTVYPGNEDLNPQFMDNYQLSAMLNVPNWHTRFESCLFYNDTKDIVKLSIDKYLNMATIKNLGWENVIEYEHKGFKARLTTYLQHVLNLKEFEQFNPNKPEEEQLDGHNVAPIPDFTTHLQLQKSFACGFAVIAKGSYCSSQRFLHDNLYNKKPLEFGFDSLYGKEEVLPSRFLLDLGLRYKWKIWELALNCNNVFDHQYRLGGDRVPVLQQGRILLGTVKLSLQ